MVAKKTGKIRNKLILLYLSPILILILWFGTFFYLIMQQGLETELSKRLISIGQAASLQIPNESILLLEKGDEDTRLYQNIRQKLINLKELNNIERIYIFTNNNLSLVDTRDDVPIGYEYLRHAFDEEELARVRKGETAASVLFTGKDGKIYKNGYISVSLADENQIFIATEGNADFYLTLRKIRGSILWLFFSIVVSIIGVSLIFAKRIGSPIGNLVKAVNKISAGNLDAKVNIKSSDEIGLLGTKFNEMRDNLIDRDNRMQMMLQGIAHEVRNPLGGIELFIGLLEEDHAESENSKSYIGKVKKELYNLNTIVDDFLDYAKNIDVHAKPVNFKDFAEEMALFFSKDMKKLNIQFETDIHIKENNLAVFDKEYFKRVFLNLFKNSIQAMPHGGKILLQAHIIKQKLNGKEKPRLEINFYDNGVGISKDNNEKLFTPFFTTKEKGTGLGSSF